MNRNKKLANMAMLVALAMIFSYVESLAHANPQKNLPKRIVYAQRTISTVTKEVSPITSPAPICVKMYFTPANAAVYTDGRNKK